MLLLFVWACSPQPGETVEVVEAEYYGVLAQDDLLPDVVIREEGSALRIVFSEEDSELWADVTFDGEMSQGLLVFTGPQHDTVEGVTIDGDALSCTYASAMATLKVTGTFEDDRAMLRLTVEKIGSVTMDRIEPGDTGDEEPLP